MASYALCTLFRHADKVGLGVAGTHWFTLSACYGRETATRTRDLFDAEPRQSRLLNWAIALVLPLTSYFLLCTVSYTFSRLIHAHFGFIPHTTPVGDPVEMGDRQPGSFSGNSQQYYHQPTPGASTSGTQQAPYYQNQVADQYYQSMNLHGYSGAMPQPASYHTSYHTAANSRPYTFGQGIGPGLPQPRGMRSTAPSQYQNAPNWGYSFAYQGMSQGQSYGPVSQFPGDQSAWQSHSQGPVGSGGIGQYAPPHAPYYAPGQWNQAIYHQGASYRPTLTLATNMQAPVANPASSGANTPDSLNAASPFSPYPSVGTPATPASAHPSPQIYALLSRLPPPAKQATPEELEEAKDTLTRFRYMDTNTVNPWLYYRACYVAEQTELEDARKSAMSGEELALYIQEMKASGGGRNGRDFSREASAIWEDMLSGKKEEWNVRARKAHDAQLLAKKQKAEEEGTVYVEFSKFHAVMIPATILAFHRVLAAFVNCAAGSEEAGELKMLICEAWTKARGRASMSKALKPMKPGATPDPKVRLFTEAEKTIAEALEVLWRTRNSDAPTKRSREAMEASTGEMADAGEPQAKKHRNRQQNSVATEAVPQISLPEEAVSGPSSVIQPPSIPLSEPEILLAIPSNEVESSPVASEHVEGAEAATNTTADVPSPASATPEEDVVPVVEDAATATVTGDASDVGRAATTDVQEEAQGGTKDQPLQTNEIEAQAGLLTDIPIVALTVTGAESAQVEPDALNANDQDLPGVQPIQEPEALPQHVQAYTEVAPAIAQGPVSKRRVRKNAATRPKTTRKSKSLPKREDTQRADAADQSEEIAPSATSQDQPIAQPIAVSLAEIEGFNKYKPTLPAKSNSPATRKFRARALALDKEVEEAIRASWIGTSSVLRAPATPKPEDRDPLAKFFNFND
ncbi:hypothetical protein D9611_002868 [Ephemerocybe angulata]|uniref:Uncharacterized protein n=1 Tax=Ephemerocybe angulata TaxID=980116 RepID=A0A8H5C860_9AGAR|nr:hypothetical protein D9611_002868 [Tulosesus angulatus]